jgi:hypothetical protein
MELAPISRNPVFHLGRKNNDGTESRKILLIRKSWSGLIAQRLIGRAVGLTSTTCPMGGKGINWHSLRLRQGNFSYLDYMYYLRL